jgi:hypothetical protein
MDYDMNVYYHPEKSGLEFFEDFEDPEASYSFDKFTIWERKTDGALFYGMDSGCSCPSPFENVNKIEDLTQITPNSWETFKKDFEAYGANARWEGSPRHIEAHKVQETLDRVRAHLYAKTPKV